jgi:hypothetical protein
LVLNEKKIQKAVITTYGATLEKAASYVVPSVLMGLIPGITQTSNTLNLINGEYFAKEIGLQVVIPLYWGKPVDHVSNVNVFRSLIQLYISG